MDTTKYNDLCLELFKNLPDMTPTQRAYILTRLESAWCFVCFQKRNDECRRGNCEWTDEKR